MTTSTAAAHNCDGHHRQLVDGLPDIIYCCTPECGGVFYSPAVTAILGFSPGHLLENPMLWHESIHPDDRQSVTGAFHDFATRRAPYALEYRIRHADGQWIWLKDRSIGICTRSGEPVIQGIAADITQYRREQEARFELERTLLQTQKAESLGRMAGAIAHNFNNVLGAIVGNLELAMGDLSITSPRFVHLAEAMQAVNRATDINTLMMAYLGQEKGGREVLDLAEACRNGLPLITSAIPDTVNVAVDAPASGPAVNANPRQIQQIMANLVTNAWESYGAAVGDIQLSVRTVAGSDIPARHRFPSEWHPREGDYACLEVTDRGCGVSRKDIDSLFDPFFSRKFTGRGLGLAATLGFVRAHQGAITVESKAGRGSVFRVFLPLSTKSPAAKTQEAPPSPAPHRTGGTMLLVEDEVMLRRAAKSLLEHLGYHVLEAGDGVEAVELFRKHREAVRFVLSDMTMPRMDGWETLTALRHMAPGLPVILASGYDLSQVMAGNHAERPQAFLGKPYSLAGLRTTINKALGER